MAAPAAVLSVLVKANTGPATSALLKFNAQLGQTDARSQRAARAVSNVVKNVSLIGAAGTVGGIAYAVRKAADFESQMSSLGAVTSASGRRMDQFRRQALKAGADTKFSALEAAQAQTELAKGGLAVSQIAKGGLRSALALAAAGEMDLADAARSTVNAMKLFNIRGKDSMKVADAFATAANSTTADVQDFAMALTQGGSAAKAAGLSFRDTVVFLEALAEAGIKNSDAGTSMKAALAQLTKPTEEAGALMKRYKIDLFDAAGNMKSLDKIAGILRSGLGGLTREQRLQVATTLAGTDGMRGLLALYDAGPEKIRKLQKEQEKQGTAAETARKKQDNLKGSLEQLHGSIETLGIQVGTGFIPFIRDAADELTDFANKAGRVLDDKDLSLGEKLQKIWDMAKVDAKPWVEKIKTALNEANIPERLGDAVSAATPVVAEAVAKLAKIVAGGFVKGFLAADVWGRLAAVGWLLARMGGPPAFLKMGQQAGGHVGAGIGTGVAASGLKGKLTGLFRSWGPTIGLALAATMGPELVKRAGKDLNPKTSGFGLDKHLTEPLTGMIPGVADLQHKLQDVFEGIKVDFDPFKGKLKIGLQDNKAALKDFGDTAEDTFKRLSEAGDSRGLVDLANRASDLANRYPEAGDALKRFAGAVSQAAISSAGSFDDISRHGGKNLRKIKQATADAAFEIQQSLGYGTQQAKEALSKNFMGAAAAIQKSMDAGKISVKTGTAEIRRLMVEALGQFGIRGKAVDRYINNQDTLTGKTTGGATGQQRGGPINMGAPTGDSVPAMLERGEYVLNRNAVSKVGRKQLDALNFGAAPRFQAGGIVSLGKRLQRMGYHVGEHPAFGGVGPGHTPTSYHYRGMALDVNADGWPGGEPAALDKLFKRLKGLPGVLELLWRVKGHFDHLHVALGGGAGGGLGGLDVPKLKKIKSGLAGAPGAMADRALSVTRSAAQDILDRAATFGGGVEGGEPDAASGGYGKTALRKLWTRAGGDPKLSNLMAAVALAESGGNPNAKNPSGASGLWQILGVPFAGDVFDPLTNAKMAVSKHQSQGLGAWEAYTNKAYQQFLQHGGLVGMQDGGHVSGGGQHRTPKRRKELPHRKLTLNGLRKKLGANFKVAFPTLGMNAFNGLVGEDGLVGKYAEELQQMADLHGLTHEEPYQTIVEVLKDGTEQSTEVLNKSGYRDERGHFVGGIDQHVAEILEEMGKAQAIEDALNLAVGKIPQLKTELEEGIAERNERMQLISQFARLEVSRRKNLEESLRKLDEKQIKTAADKKAAVTNAVNAADVDKDGLRDQIANLQAQKGTVKTTAERNRLNDEIQSRRKRIDDVDDRLRRLRQDGGSAAAVRLHKFALRDDIRDVKGTLEHWVGNASNNAADRDAWEKRSVGGDLRDAVKDRWQKSLETLTDGARELPGKAFDAFINKEKLRQEYEDWRDTPAPKTPAASPQSRDDSERVSALEQLLREANLRTDVAQRQFRVFGGFPQFGGGGIVPGPSGAAVPAVVHGGEGVFTKDQMAALGGAGGQQVVVVVQDGAVREDRIKVLAGKEAEAVVRRAGRTGARVLPGAGGGGL